jgi:hypothetical protein
LAMSRQSWRKRSTLYTKRVLPRRDILLQGEGEGNTGMFVWNGTDVVAPGHGWLRRPEGVRTAHRDCPGPQRSSALMISAAGIGKYILDTREQVAFSFSASSWNGLCASFLLR